MEQMKRGLEGALWRVGLGAIVWGWILLFGAAVYLLLG